MMILYWRSTSAWFYIHAWVIGLKIPSVPMKAFAIVMWLSLMMGVTAPSFLRLSKRFTCIGVKGHKITLCGVSCC